VALPEDEAVDALASSGGSGKEIFTILAGGIPISIELPSGVVTFTMIVEPVRRIEELLST
jgi:hypothetical protein